MASIINDLISYLQCGENIALNDAIYISDVDNKIYKYDPLDATQVFAGIAKEAGILNAYVRVVQSGRIKGFSGLTPGQFVYASVTVPGGFQLVEPVSSQKVILGIAKSATELTINGGLGIKPGGEGGGGGLDTYYIEDMEGLADTTGFATGNNAAFLGGGTLQGTLVVDDVAPISGTKSLKYTQAVGSLNDYFASEVIDLDIKQRDNTSGMTLYFTYDGNDNDMRFVVYDVTNGAEIASEVNFVKVANKATRYSLSFYVPTSCTQIRWGAQVLVENSGKILVVDDVEMSTNPFVSKDILQTQNSVVNQSASFGVADITGAATSTRGSGIFSYNAATGVYTTLRTSTINVSATFVTTASATVLIQISHSVLGTVALSNSLATAEAREGTAVEFISNPGETFKVSNNGGTTTAQIISVSATATTSHILTPSDTFSTDTAPLTYANSSQYNLSTLANAPIGTYITFTHAANTNTRTQTTTRPTQTDADMNVNGIQIFTRAYNAASTADQPAEFFINIGKGFKGISLGLYTSVGKSSGLIVGNRVDSSSIESGVKYIYNESSGLLAILGSAALTTNTTRVFNDSTEAAVNNGYLTINAGKTLPLLAVPVPLVAYLKDVKPSGTAGGTFTAGSWQTRTLNTVEGDSSIVSLSGNQFVLGPGRYEIEASAPAFNVSQHKTRIRNITNVSTSSVGSSEQSPPSSYTQTLSLLKTVITLTSSKVFELQHYCGSTSATLGFGVATNSGESEIYSQISIKKIG